MSPSRRAAGARPREVQESRTPRCAHTSLTKPECHCPACLFEQIAAHCPQPEPARGAPEIRRVAACGGTTGAGIPPERWRFG
jgi:hypothetical protein